VRFFYSGARALLVSHWYVDSDATVTLITETFNALHTDPAIGRSEALRRAMAALIAGGGRAAHPAAWAAFNVVGEGGKLHTPPAVRAKVPKLATKGPPSTAKAKPHSPERDSTESVLKN
jgi:hypothetical protein